MKSVLAVSVLAILFQPTHLMSQEIVKIEENAKETRYLAVSVNLYFSVPNGWRVAFIPSGHDIPLGIGLTPQQWDYPVLENGDTLDHSEYAIQILVGAGSIDSIVKAEGKTISDLPGKLVELKNWRYFNAQIETSLYIKGGGYYGKENCYASTLDNRHGKIVYLLADPLFDERKIIYQIENSLSFK
jgi:hypothetical protein